jgi:hypothetical protein
MKPKTLIFRKTLVSASIATLLITSSVATAAIVPYQTTHVFKLTDLVGDFQGTTFSYATGTGTGNGGDPTILCGIKWAPNVPPCPVDGPQPIVGISSPKLFPVDSEFGFHVVPFAKAVPKTRGDGVWGEGFVGSIYDGSNNEIGVEISDAATDTFVVPNGMGTWCTGLGGESVKCSSEHYTVMEQVLTCHETIPYYYANPLTGEQLEIEDPADPGTVLVYCDDKVLDNNLLIVNNVSEYPGGDASTINGKLVGDIGYDPDTGGAIPVVDWAGDASWADPDDPLTFLEPNEANVLDDISYGRSFSMTAKDDGKPLFRWGNMIKKPNDVRFYTRFPLPKVWKQWTSQQANSNNGLRVTKALLIVNHKVTNNPNDQLRPEDMENEGAVGRLPGYDRVNTYGTDSWISDVDCYQGNGIEILQETVLKNPNFAVPDTTFPHTWDNHPYGWSADLRTGLTAGWYSTLDREPFEWSYDTDGDGASDDSYRAPLSLPLPDGTTLLSGPRWRLTPGKIGQDVPHIDVPKVNCAPPPYQKDMIKYPVGDEATELVEFPGPTIINLLDWKSTDARSVTDPASGKPVSPLTFTNGWINGWYNEGTILQPGVPLVNPIIKAVTINGAPVTQDFDLSIYIKGDRKPTAIYNARLEVEYDDGQP